MEYKPRRKRIVYTDPLDKLKAVERIVHDHVPTRVIAEELSVSLTSVQQWAKQYKDYGPAFFTNKESNLNPGVWVDSQEYSRLKEIEKDFEEKQLQVEILKKFQTFLRSK